MTEWGKLPTAPADDCDVAHMERVNAELRARVAALELELEDFEADQECEDRCEKLCARVAELEAGLESCAESLELALSRLGCPTNGNDGGGGGKHDRDSMGGIGALEDARNLLNRK